LLNILRKKPKDRNFREILILTRFIENTELITLLKNENFDESCIGGVLNALSANIEVEYKEKGLNVFECRDMGDKFYIILIGKVNVLKPILKDYFYDYCSYYKHLIKLKADKENYLLSTTIANNSAIFPVRVEDLDIIEEVMFKFRLQRKIDTMLNQLRLINIHTYHYNCENEIADLMKFFKDNNRLHTKYDLIIPESVYDKLETVHELLREFNEKFVQDNTNVFEVYSMLDIDYVDNGNSVIDANHCKAVKITEYEQVTVLKEGQHFGDTALSSKSKERNATIKTDDECFFATLTDEVFHKYVKEERDKLIVKDTNFINDLIFFKNIKKPKFSKSYYNDFVTKIFPLGHVICKEAEQPSELYIIKEGHVELRIKKSILDLHAMITQLKKLDPRYKPQKPFDERMSKLKEFQKKKNFVLFKLTTGKTIGLMELIYQTAHFCEVVVSSDKAKFSTLDPKKLQGIMEYEKFTANDIKAFSFEKLTMLIDRLSTIKNTCIKIAIKENKSQSMNIRNEDLVLSPRVEKNFEILHSKLEKKNIASPDSSSHRRDIAASYLHMSNSLKRNYTFLTEMEKVFENKNKPKPNNSNNNSMINNEAPGKITKNQIQSDLDGVRYSVVKERPKTNAQHIRKRSIMIEEIMLNRLAVNLVESNVYRCAGRDIDIGLIKNNKPFIRSNLPSPIRKIASGFYPSSAKSDFKTLKFLKQGPRLFSATRMSSATRITNTNDFSRLTNSNRKNITRSGFSLVRSAKNKNMFIY
jgi:CRP-like cAMP-binding protein